MSWQRAVGEFEARISAVLVISHCVSSGQDDRRSFVSWRDGERRQDGKRAAATAAAAATRTTRWQERADKAACNFIRQRRILIRIPPLDRLVLATNRSTTASGRGKREEGQFLSGKWNIFGSWASCSDRVRFHRLLYRHWILRRLPVADKWNHFNDPPGSRPPLRSTTEYRL